MNPDFAPAPAPARLLARGLLAGLLVALLGASPAAAEACPAAARPSPALSMPQGAQALREGRPLRILAIGSSSTSGVGASTAQANYPSQLAGRLVAAWGEGKVEVTNAGVGGESAPATLSRLKSFLAAQPGPDLVLWQVGTNDVIFGGNPASLNAMVLDGLGAIQASGAAVVVIDQQYFPGISNLERYEAFVAAVDGAARARGVPLLKRYAMTKDWAARDPQGFRATLSWDSFHSNDAGYSCLADLLAPAILAAARPPAKPAAAAPKGTDAKSTAPKPAAAVSAR